MFKYTLTLILSFHLCVGYSQQPAYFILGENQFKGLKVFDIIQDQNQFYYFATNEGLIKFDYINYSKIEVKSAKSISFFNLTINKYGTIYFNNLNNQIFELKHGKCKLFHELNNNFGANLIHLTNDNLGNLMIGCKGLIVLDTAGKVVVQKQSKTIHNTSYKFNDNTWIFPTAINSVYYYSNKEIIEKKLKIKNNDLSPNNLMQFFDFNDSNYVLDLLSKKLYHFNKINWELTSIISNDFFYSSTNARLFITDNKIWSPSSISGINYCENTLNKTYKTFYQDYFISDVFQDKEGNILLGTFDKGVMVIPNIKIPDVINSFSMDPMISVYADREESVFLGSNKGKLFHYENNQLKTISDKNKKPIEGVYSSNSSKYILFDDEKIKVFNKITGQIFELSSASLKDVVFITDNQMYLGTNVGILKATIKEKNNSEVEFLKEQKYRIYSLAYDLVNKKLYSSSANGLFVIDSAENGSKINYNGKDIFPEKIICESGILYAVLREIGILKLYNNKFELIKPAFSLQDESIKNIKTYQNTLIVSTTRGLYQLNEKGEIIQKFHSLYGFNSKKVYQFSIYGDDLWVSHLGGVQKIDLSYQINYNKKPQIVLKDLKVNNVSVDFKGKFDFNSSERKFDFYIYSPTIVNNENIKYHYQLKGYDESWQIQNSNNHIITYNALSPGTYILRFKAENSGKFSSEKQYTFTINKPLFLRWWFIVLMVLLFLLLVYLVYKRQLSVQKEKSRQINELNLSKLTAIQSQMNPHFIFNSLNSIQEMVLQQNGTKAYDSIGKFALLIRKIMHHSEKEYIDIEEELSMLNVYLELEFLRFKKDFVYTINSHQISDIEIPPMLIQPYIENAIKHGLLHKEGEKRLTIDMYIQNNLFICEITDNGIGRKKSQEMKERQNKLYESFSGKSLDKRLEILKKHLGGDFGVEMVDLYDNNNQSSGTKVILRAPFKQKY